MYNANARECAHVHVEIEAVRIMFVGLFAALSGYNHFIFYIYFFSAASCSVTR